jgi:uncharacterized protein
MKLSLTLLEQSFTIHRLEPDAELPKPALRSSFFAVTRTDEELSLVLPDSVKIESNRSDLGWACFKVQGPLEFQLVGVLAGISSVLAEAGVPIFVISTFDTDYILVKREHVQVAREALISKGYNVSKN